METAIVRCVLKWNKYEKNITKGINSFRNVDDFYDVTLVGDDLKQVTAHRLVLSASSAYFKKILQNNKGSNHPILCLEGLYHSDINNIMDFIYNDNGQLELPQDEVKRYLHIAQRLKLFGIYEPTETTHSNNGTSEDSNEDKTDNEQDDSETLSEDTYKNKEECKNEQPSEGSAENSKKDESDIEQHDELDTMVEDTYQDKEECKNKEPQKSSQKNVEQLFSNKTKYFRLRRYDEV